MIADQEKIEVAALSLLSAGTLAGCWSNNCDDAAGEGMGDRHHEKADRVYRLVKGGSANSAELWAPALEAEFAEVERAVRLMGGFSRALVTHEDGRYQEPGGLYADAAVFDVFSWPLLRGAPTSALSAPFSVVLTEPMARKHFGADDPIGKTLTIGGISNDGQQRLYTVTGVMAPPPHTSRATRQSTEASTRQKPRTGR